VTDTSAPTIPGRGHPPAELPPHERPTLTIDGKSWEPRAKLAKQVPMSAKSAQRLRAHTTYVCNVAYCERDDFFKKLIGRRERNKPPPQKFAPGPARSR
jgi:hypothetical protein